MCIWTKNICICNTYMNEILKAKNQHSYMNECQDTPTTKKSGVMHVGAMQCKQQTQQHWPTVTWQRTLIHNAIEVNNNISEVSYYSMITAITYVHWRELTTCQQKETKTWMHLSIPTMMLRSKGSLQRAHSQCLIVNL